MCIRETVSVLSLCCLTMALKAEDLRKPIEPETIAAYEKLKATFGGFRSDSLTGESNMFSPGKESAAKGLPGFQFRKVTLTKLPSPTTPFGLELNEVTDADLAALKGVQNCELLRISSKKVTNTGLKAIQGLNNLTTLSLDHCERITDAGLKEIKPLKELTTLELDGTRVTKEGIKGLKEFKKLSRLSLVEMQFISDAWVADLAVLKNLVEVAVNEDLGGGGTSGLTKSGRQELQKALPKCKVIFR